MSNTEENVARLAAKMVDKMVDKMEVDDLIQFVYDALYLGVA